MLESERQNRILIYLDTHAYATVHELSRETSSSEATIRRDLSKLHRGGACVRIRGGARSFGSTGPSAAEASAAGPGEVSLSARSAQFRLEKTRIAETAAALCADNELIFIDGGSTTYQMHPFLLEKNLSVVTNSFAIARELSRSRSCSVILPGGIIYPESDIILNPFDNTFFGNFEAARVFMGAAAITSRGVENRDTRIIQAEKAMIEHSKELIILADSSKFETSGGLLLCPIDQVTRIITDSGIPEKVKTAIESKGIILTIV